jgi:tripartite-type tricarboxylate transporter receptor subunit TctC
MFYKLLFVFAILISNISVAQSDPIEIVVPAVAGGPTDAVSRVLSRILTDNGVENFVSNHGGGEGDVGYNVAMQKKDNVIFVAPVSYYVFSHVIQHRENLHAKNMNIIAPSIISPMSIMTGPKGFKSLKEMIDVAKIKDVPCGLSGGYAHVALEMINAQYKTKFVPVPYKGSGQASIDIMGDHIECNYDAAGVYVPKHNAGLLKILAVNAKTPGLTNVPLISTIITDNKFSNWYGFGIPKEGNVNGNEKVLTILNNYSSYTDYLKTLYENGFIPATPRKNINQIMIEQTESSRQFYIDHK